MSWEPAVKTIPLDASIGLAAAPGAPLTVRQRHPYEMLMTAAGDGAVDGGSLTVELDPFSLKLIQIDSLPPAEPFVTGVPYEIVPGPGDGRFGLKLLGRPGQKADVSLRGFGDRPVRTAAGIDVPTGDTPWAVAFPGAAAAGPSFARLADLRDDPAAAADGPHLTELAKFTLDDDALEIREMVRLRREPSSLAEIEACRAYMWDKVVAAEGTSRNAFDGDPGTRWSDGFPRRSPFTGSPAAYRSETSLWRIDLGKPTDLGRLELRVVRRTDAAVLEAVETSTDLRTWARVGGLSLAAADGIPFSAELKQRGQTIRVFDVDAGDKAPVAISVPLAGSPCRYVRIRGRNFGVAEIVGYDGAGKLLDRSGWKATNFLGETTVPRRVLTAVHVPAEDAPGREYAVAVTAGPAKFDPVDGVYVVALVDGRAVVPRHRAPSYPYHNFEWNSGAPKLAGMTFRLPIDRAWKGKTVEFRVMMFGDGADGAQAVLRLVTPRPVFAELPLRVGAPGTVRPVPAPAPAPPTARRPASASSSMWPRASPTSSTGPSARASATRSPATRRWSWPSSGSPGRPASRDIWTWPGSSSRSAASPTGAPTVPRRSRSRSFRTRSTLATAARSGGRGRAARTTSLSLRRGRPWATPSGPGISIPLWPTSRGWAGARATARRSTGSGKASPARRSTSRAAWERPSSTTRASARPTTFPTSGPTAKRAPPRRTSSGTTG
jgi:hypothetical protein